MAKKALCIGINNYPGTDMDLRGCVNDAEDWAATLAARGFTVQKLIDAQATKADNALATKATEAAAREANVAETGRSSGERSVNGACVAWGLARR